MTKWKKYPYRELRQNQLQIPLWLNRGRTRRTKPLLTFRVDLSKNKMKIRMPIMHLLFKKEILI